MMLTAPTRASWTGDSSRTSTSDSGMSVQALASAKTSPIRAPIAMSRSAAWCPGSR
jgi:hypothetical protein